MISLNVKAALAFLSLAVVMGLLLFIPAGTVAYWQGWVFLAVYTGASLVVIVYLVRYDQALMQRRMTGGPTVERERSQKIIMTFATIGFAALLVVPALDYRFGWSNVPLAVVILGNVLVAVGFAGQVLAFRENTFAASTIEIAKHHRVISTGPYAFVRHPQYAAAFLYLLGMPLALGSYWGLLVLAAMMAAIMWRLFDEERLLAARLPGYAEYQRRVRWRLLPGIF
jgi:protein-S-isoprenylcysteine O-methyltransferase Ste14